MVKFSIDIAKKSDDADLKNILRKTHMPGDMSLTFETEPSFFKAISILGIKQTVLAIRDEEKKIIVGFVIRSIKKVFIDEKITNVGYLSSVRILEEYRGSRLLYLGVKKLNNILDKSLEKINFTTIISDNFYAQKVISTSRVGLPNYVNIGVNKTFAIKPTKKNRYNSLSKIKIQRGIDGFSIEEIISFINENGKKKDFFPVFSKEILENLTSLNFNLNSMYVAYIENKLLGVIGCWDQTEFKQTIVKGLSLKYKLLRYINNYFLTHIYDTPIITNVGKKIKAFYLNYIVIKESDKDIFSQMIDAISNDYSSKDYNYFLVGLDQNDPLCGSMSNFRSFNYDAIVYLVNSNRKSLSKDRIKYLDISRL